MVDEKVMMEGVRIVYRNFAGNEGPYNRKGVRNFSVIVSEDVARAMESDGWNIKWPKPRLENNGEEDTRLPTLPIEVNFNERGPRVLMIGSESKKRTILDEDSVSVLDWVDIETVDLTVRPYNWTVNDNSGVKAYLHNIFVTIREDLLELKYAEDDQEAARVEAVDEPAWEE